MPNLINFDQTGFITGRKARDSAIKIVDLIHHFGALKILNLVLSTDAKKRF